MYEIPIGRWQAIRLELNGQVTTFTKSTGPLYKFNEEGLVQHAYWDRNKEKWNISTPMNVAERGGCTVLMEGKDIKYLVMYISQQELQLGVFDETTEPKMIYFLERKGEEPKGR